jgi:glycosyltransferase involved in cell wall biosynthesis
MSKKRSVEITVPVYNEEKELESNIVKLFSFCKEHLSLYDFTITIADNASTDGTSLIGQNLSRHCPDIKYIRFSEKGRGRAVKSAWIRSGKDICAYMDIDLSTNLRHLLPLLDSLAQGDFDIAIGSRLLRNSKVIERSIKRELISRMYNILIKIFFQTRFSDAQCGFKAVTQKVVTELIPRIDDNEWFMDSELLIIGEKMGYRIYEEPVEWNDNPGSTVRVLPTALGDMKGLIKLFIKRPWSHT